MIFFFFFFPIELGRMANVCKETVFEEDELGEGGDSVVRADVKYVGLETELQFLYSDDEHEVTSGRKFECRGEGAEAVAIEVDGNEPFPAFSFRCSGDNHRKALR